MKWLKKLWDFMANIFTFGYKKKYEEEKKRKEYWKQKAKYYRKKYQSLRKRYPQRRYRQYPQKKYPQKKYPQKKYPQKKAYAQLPNICDFSDIYSFLKNSFQIVYNNNEDFRQRAEDIVFFGAGMHTWEDLQKFVSEMVGMYFEQLKTRKFRHTVLETFRGEYENSIYSVLRNKITEIRVKINTMKRVGEEYEIANADDVIRMIYGTREKYIDYLKEVFAGQFFRIYCQTDKMGKNQNKTD